jgi:hypothetical protein
MWVYSEIISISGKQRYEKNEKETLHLTGGLAQLGGKVFARISVCPLTVGGCPKCVQLNPQLRQAARALCAMLADSAKGQ